MRVVDGDTIVVLTEKSKTSISTAKVRLIGVDTPETVHPFKPVERYGKEASTFLTNMLKGEDVYLLYEGKTPTKDKYGRLLAYVYRAPDGLFVNAEIVRQGYGYAYVNYPFKYMGQFKQLERAARTTRRGLWVPAKKSTPVVSTPKKEPAKKPATVIVKPTTPKPVIKPVVPPVVRPRPPTATRQVYRTRTGKKYHLGSCRYLRSSRIPISLSEAKRRYGPCSVCGPPR
jgi:micrococcal nuclease